MAEAFTLHSGASERLQLRHQGVWDAYALDCGLSFKRQTARSGKADTLINEHFSDQHLDALEIRLRTS